MTRADALWKERRKILQERSNRLRVDECRIERGESGYRLVCLGFGFVPALSPPRVALGGVVLKDIKYLEQGRRLEADFEQLPENRTVVLDFVYATATVEAGTPT